MTKLTPAQRGALGGQVTARKHGRPHMESIGREGHRVTCERYHGGDTHAYMDALRLRGASGAFDSKLGCHVIHA